MTSNFGGVGNGADGWCMGGWVVEGDGYGVWMVLWLFGNKFMEGSQ